VEPSGAHERLFTPDEANAALADVRPLVERMVAAKRSLDAAEERRDETAGRIAGNGGGIAPQQLADLHADVQRCATALAAAVDDVSAHGAIVKDLDSGLVDFPSLRDGRPVLLCWRLGENEVAWWHGYEDGFAGRRPLTEP
jgi:hypothetical protein